MKRFVGIWLLFVTAVLGENYVRVESPADSRIYTVDLDATAVQRALRPVDEATVAARLPKWLYPGPDFKPSRPNLDPITGVVSGTFLIAGTVEQVSMLYDQALRAHGLRVSSLPYGAGAGLQMTGSGGAITVTIQIRSQTGSIQATATFAPHDAPREHFDVVWYDDRTGILRVREAATGGEYQLDKRSIVSNNLNRPGAVASESAAIPSWLPVYPGATGSPKGRITWMFTPTAELVTGDGIRKVYEFYLAQLPAAGATIKSSGINRSGTPLRDFDAYVIAVKSADRVEIRIGELVRMGFPASTSGPRTGIGIRYTVPKQ